LGQGTTESHAKMTDAISELWPYSQDLLLHSQQEKEKWQERVDTIFAKASLKIPGDVKMITGGFEGKHTPHLAAMLHEMQYLQRTYPGVEW
jgi:ring-1,2-phenylacetyl-CoA epoxidase subunit PaaC